MWCCRPKRYRSSRIQIYECLWLFGEDFFGGDLAHLKKKHFYAVENKERKR
jgi:hypothetical protein